MKTIISVLAMLLFLVSGTPAQLPPNGGFENWVISIPGSYEDPEFWATTNIIGLPANVTKTGDAHSGSYAVKLETGTGIFSEPFIAGAVCSYGINIHPAKLTGYYKADLIGDDYSSITVYFYNSEVGVIGFGSLDLIENKNVFTSFELPIDFFLPEVPADSFTVSIFSSQGNSAIGTTLIIDALAFEGISATYSPWPLESKIVLMPNPASDHIVLEVPEIIDNVIFRMFDAYGRKLVEKTFSDRTTIDVSAQPPGMYYYEVMLENKLWMNGGRFVVSR